MASKKPAVRRRAQKRYRERHAVKLRESRAAYAKAHPEIYRKASLKHYHNNREAIIARRHGLTLERYGALPNHCQICGSIHRLCVDHHHKQKAVRGRLCNDCNIGIGQMKENIALMRSAIAYLLSRGKHDVGAFE